MLVHDPVDRCCLLSADRAGRSKQTPGPQQNEPSPSQTVKELYLFERDYA
jgi:hypothetical protein